MRYMKLELRFSLCRKNTCDETFQIKLKRQNSYYKNKKKYTVKWSRQSYIVTLNKSLHSSKIIILIITYNKCILYDRL